MTSRWEHSSSVHVASQRARVYYGLMMASWQDGRLDLPADVVEVDGLGTSVSSVRARGCAVRMTLAKREQAALHILERITTMGDDSPSLDVGIVPLLRQVGYFRAEEVGCVLNGRPVKLQSLDFANTRPRQPVQLFRVCDPGREQRLSWSTYLQKVLQYAPDGSLMVSDFHREPHLFSCVVPPSRILAVVNGYEWVVDVSGLRITDHGAVSNVTSVRLADLPDQPQKAELLAMLGPDYMVLQMPDDRYVVRSSGRAS